MIFSEDLTKVIEEAQKQCYRLKAEALTVDAYILACLSIEDGCIAKDVIKEKIDPLVLKEAIESNYDIVESNTSQIEDLKFSNAMARVLETIVVLEIQSGNFKQEDITSLHILYCIVKEGSSEVIKILHNSEITEEFLRNKIKQKTSKKREQEKKKTILNTYCINLNEIAHTFHPIVGREKEINRMIQILGRKEKNNPVLIGEAGVGKTALIEGLATRIVAGDVPDNLKSKIIFSLNLNSIISGTSLRGQFEKRMESIIEELENNRDFIIFIDELHTVISAGSGEGSLDASNILKPYLSRGAIQCVGATTLKEYRKYIEKDSALDRRFQSVIVRETNTEETLYILNKLRPTYEKYHNILYSDDCLTHCVALSQRYLSNKVNPDKSIDILDEIGSKIKNTLSPELEKLKQDIKDIGSEIVMYKKKQDAEKCKSLADQKSSLIITFDQKKKEYFKQHKAEKKDAEEIISLMTGIPISKISSNEVEKLNSSIDEIKKKLIGQNSAIDSVIKAIKRNRIGFKDVNTPIGSFIFLGPTGVGKTQLAKLIAELIFDGKDSLIRIDMSEYMEKFSVSRLIGAPPGYVGYEEGGQLTEAVRRRPYSVILLDEVEKAHPDVFNIFLQVLGEGRLTDSDGKTIDFKNTIIIMTSNLGSSRENSHIGFGDKNPDDVKIEISKSFNKFFPKEFINRLDGVVIFDPLSKESIGKILDNELQILIANFIQNYPDYNIKLTERAIAELIEKGYDEKFGARNLKRKIEDYIGEVISDEVYLRPDKRLLEIDFDSKFVCK